MAQASDIFSHLRQNHGPLRQNHGPLRQNHGDLRQNHGDLHRNHGDLHRSSSNEWRPAPESGDLHRSSSNECCYSAAPAPSLSHTNTATQPHRHLHSATPAPSLRRTSAVTPPHTFRHISSCEAWRDSIRYCHRGKEPYLGFCRFVH